MTLPASANDHNAQVIEQFRAHNGQLPAGAPLLLLTTTGAKSGQPRLIPLVHTRDGDRYVIVASKAGADANPDWYHNLLANPEVTVEVGAEKFTATARVAQGTERDRLFQAHAARMPTFSEYQTKTSRTIPVVLLERTSGSSATPRSSRPGGR